MKLKNIRKIGGRGEVVIINGESSETVRQDLLHGNFRMEMGRAGK